MECEAEDGVVLRGGGGWVREEAVEEVVMCVVGEVVEEVELVVV